MSHNDLTRDHNGTYLGITGQDERQRGTAEPQCTQMNTVKYRRIDKFFNYNRILIKIIGFD